MHIEYLGYSLWLHEVGVSSMTHNSDGTVSIKVDMSKEELENVTNQVGGANED